MSRRGDPFDNAQAVSFIRTFETEADCRMHYETLEDVSIELPRFVDEACNARRLHCSPGYLGPVQLEDQYARYPAKTAA